MGSLGELFFTTPAPWFTVPALIGTAGYLIKLLVGAGHEDGGLGDGASGDAAGGASAGSDVGSTALSLHGLFAFLMGFGWGGLACLHGIGWGMPASTAGGLGTGVAFVGVVVAILRGGRRLQSSGNVSLGSLVGLEGEVYTAVPAEGKGLGRVRTVLGDRERFVSATTEGAELPARTRVVIERVNGDNSVLVRARERGRS